MPVIDIHNHFFPRTWPDLSARYGTPDWPCINHIEADKADIMLGDRFFRRIDSACWDPDVRLQQMDRDKVDLQVMSATPVLFAYERPVEHALDCARLFNDAALELCGKGRGRLKSFCQVPLQDVDAACKELSRCMRAGHLGVQIGNHVGEKNLDDPGIVTFLHHCADEGAAVLVHPWDMLGHQRMPNYMMPWTVAMPAETQLGIVALILSGAFDKLPSKLRICFAHGGGSFAFLLGRLQNAWEHHPVARGQCELPPRSYVNRFYVDSAVFDQRALQFLVNTMGAERVMLGSDYPFPLGEHGIGNLIRSSQLSSVAKERMLGGNAVEFLGLSGTELPSEKTQSNGIAPEIPQAEQLTYSSYLRVPELLSLQHPQSSPQHHDEMLFIIVHQTYELWFKELLHDLDAVVTSQRSGAKAELT
jgi:aminocarboxymuconate-semialdehyde decarboxylase